MKFRREFDHERFADFAAEVYALAISRGYQVAREITYEGGFMARVTFVQLEEPDAHRDMRLTQATIRHDVRGGQRD